MSFVHPILAIAGVCAVALPIAIHLLMRRKHKPIAWGAMKFLLEAYQQQRRRLQLEQWLLLLSRCLLVALVGLAIARPAIKSLGIERTDQIDVYLVIDNSLTSQVLDPETGKTAFESHVATAHTILDQLASKAGAASRAGVVLLASPADPVFVPPSSNLSRVRESLDAIPTTESRADISTAFELVRTSVGAAPETDAMVVLLSEFRDGSIETTETLSGLTAPNSTSKNRVTLVFMEPAAQARDNIAIQWVEHMRTNRAVVSDDGSAGATGLMRVGLKRFGQGVRSAATTSVVAHTHTIDDEPSVGARDNAVAVEWQPGESTATAIVPIQNTVANGMSDADLLVRVVASSPEDTLGADNASETVVGKMDRIRVGLVSPRSVPGASAKFDPNNPADWLRIGLEPAGLSSTNASPLNVRTIDPGTLDAASVRSFDAIIVPDPSALQSLDWAALGVFATEHHGVVVFMPTPGGGAQMWTDQFEREFSTGWTIAREPVEGDLTLAHELSVDSIGQRLLTVLGPELEPLVQPVHVQQSLDVRSPASDVVLALDTGAPLLVATELSGVQSNAQNGAQTSSQHKPGMVVLFTSSLSFAWTDLPGRPMFIPLLHELIHQSVAAAQAEHPFIAGQRIMLDRFASQIKQATAQQLPVDIGVGGTSAILRNAGVYTKMSPTGEAAGTIIVRADAIASATGVVSFDTISEMFERTADEVVWLKGSNDTVFQGKNSVSVAGLFATNSAGRSVWRLLLALGLVFALIELVLARMTSSAHGQPKMGNVRAMFARR